MTVRRSLVEAIRRPASVAVIALATAPFCATARAGQAAGDTSSTSGADGTIASQEDEQQLEEVTITAKRLRLLGTAVTASEGVVTAQELQLAPIYRPGQLFETVPGLIVTSHSGEGDAHNGYSLTGMYYHDLWNNTTDIPIRAITEGVVPNRFGTLNPTDGDRAQRASFSARYHRTVGPGQLLIASYFTYNELHLYNDLRTQPPPCLAHSDRPAHPELRTVAHKQSMSESQDSEHRSFPIRTYAHVL